MDEDLSRHADPARMSGVTLAYIGDAVFELMARRYMIELGEVRADILHRMTTGAVNAMSQSEMALKASESLSAEEISVFRRARNAHKLTGAKNQKVSDYRRATGLEAVFGYLFLKGDYERLTELFNRCMEIHFETRE